MTWLDTGNRPELIDKPGQRFRGSEMELVLAQIDALTDTDWTDYSTGFAINGSSSDPTQGNSTITAEYHQIPGSKLVTIRFRYTIGSTFAAGSGNYDFPLPSGLPEASPTIMNGTGTVSDTGTAIRWCSVISNTSTSIYVFRNDQGSPIGSAGPGTAWATGDWIQVVYPYVTSA